MSLWELLVIAVGLSMDAFAVSVCKGLSVQKVKTKHYLIVAAYFGGFQALMPLLGYLLGVRFEAMVANVDHWIAFVLLGLIGANMVRESRAGEEKLDDSFTVSTMLILAVATSIDALAIGDNLCFSGCEYCRGDHSDRYYNGNYFRCGTQNWKCVRKPL